jgi:8-oxo-dGTP pyrophosphatase MutT (NUDIX family)
MYCRPSIIRDRAASRLRHVDLFDHGPADQVPGGRHLLGEFDEHGRQAVVTPDPTAYLDLHAAILATFVRFRRPRPVGPESDRRANRGRVRVRVCHCGRIHNGLWGAAGLVLSNAAGHVLLARRSGYVHRPGTWAFPGGTLEAGETDAECALREADEELGIDPDAVVVGRTVVGWTTAPGATRTCWRPLIPTRRRPGSASTGNRRRHLGAAGRGRRVPVHPDLRTPGPASPRSGSARRPPRPAPCAHRTVFRRTGVHASFPDDARRWAVRCSPPWRHLDMSRARS